MNKTKHRAQNRDVFENFNDVVSENRACVCAARHLSRPAMSPSSPFRIINIVHTLQLDWWRLFFYGWVVGWGWAVIAEVQRT